MPGLQQIGKRARAQSAQLALPPQQERAPAQDARPDRILGRVRAHAQGVKLEPMHRPG